MADLSTLSNEDLLKIARGETAAPKEKAASGPDLSKYSNEDLMRIANGEKPAPKAPPSLSDRAFDAVSNVGEKALGAVSAAGRFVDKYTGAPTRAALGAAQEGQNPFRAFGKQFGEDPTTAPTGKDIAQKAGLSGEARTAQITLRDPTNPRDVTVVPVEYSPAGLAGVGIDAAADYTNFLPIGTAARVAGESIGPKLLAHATPVIESLQATGQGLKDLASEKAVKAAFGNAAAPYRQVGGAESKQVHKLGQVLLKGEDGIEPVVGFFDRAKNIEDKAYKALEKTWDKVDEIHKAADEKGIVVDGGDVATNILNRAAKIKDVPGNQSLINQLQSEALFYENKGPLPLSELQDYKREYNWKRPTGNTAKDALGPQGSNAVRSSIAEAMKDVVKNTDLPGKENYPDLLDKYGTYATAAGPAAETAIREAKNRSGSLTDYLAATAGTQLLGNEAKTESKAFLSAILGYANKVGRERGNSSIATVAQGVGNLLQNSPQLLQKYGGAFDEALKIGPEALAATHSILLQKDPEYKKAFESSQPNAFQRRLQNGGK